MKKNIEISDLIEKGTGHGRSGFDISLKTSRDWQEGILGLFPLLPVDASVRVWKVVVLAMFMFLFLLMIVGRLFHLQIIKGREYYILSEQNKIIAREHFSERGVIYDRDGKVIARNSPSFSIGLVHSEVKLEDYDRLKSNLFDLFPDHIDEITSRLENAQSQPYKETLIIKNVSHDQQILIQAQQADFPGVFILRDDVRSYPEGNIYSAVLGYTGAVQIDEIEKYGYEKYVNAYYVGKSGIEYQYENYLAGSPSKSILETEASGKVFKELKMSEGSPGKDLSLTLQDDVQRHLYQLLSEGIKEYDAWGGSGIVMNLSNGEVLGMVSLPTYDNNIFTSSSEQEIQNVLNDPGSLLVNRAVGGLYAPGSTVKMAIGGYALEKGVISASTQISGKPQVIRVGGWEFPDWTHSWGAAAHGMMDVTDAIANSSDIFFYKLGGGYPPECRGAGEGGSSQSCDVNGLGVEGVVSALRAFGLGQKTGIDLPEEAAGLVPDPNWKVEVRNEPWFLGNTYHLSIGQGDLLSTPIQILYLTSIIATDGSTSVPHLLKNDEIANELGLMNKKDKPISLTNIQLAREGMVQGVESGIVYSLRGSKVSVAAKTGTAEFGQLNAKGEYETHAWVTGFAPVDNPKIGFVFMLEAGGKSSNAAEVARKFVDWYFE